MLKNVVTMATNRLKYDKYNNMCDFSKGNVNIFMKVQLWIDGSMEIMHMIILILTIGSILRGVLLAKFGDLVKISD
jgi:hypothetical protein